MSPRYYTTVLLLPLAATLVWIMATVAGTYAAI